MAIKQKQEQEKLAILKQQQAQEQQRLDELAQNKKELEEKHKKEQLRLAELEKNAKHNSSKKNKNASTVKKLPNWPRNRKLKQMLASKPKPLHLKNWKPNKLPQNQYDEVKSSIMQHV